MKGNHTYSGRCVRNSMMIERLIIRVIYHKAIYLNHNLRFHDFDCVLLWWYSISTPGKLIICLTTVYKTARQNKKNHDYIAMEGTRLSFEISLILESA